MIRVTVDLLPFGDERRKEGLGTLTIENTSGTGELANYEWGITDIDGVWRSGHVTNFPRTRLSAWHLLRLVLDGALDE